MADLTRTQAQVAHTSDDPSHGTVTRTFISAAALTQGQPIYIDTNGKAEVADASAAGTAGVRGIALKQVGAAQPVTCLVQGPLYGFDLSGVAYDGQVYLSDTAGELADAAGTVSVVVGRVQPLSDSTPTKVLYVNLHAIS